MGTSRIGLIGLGTMGAALALNMANNGVSVAVYNRTTQRTHDFVDGAGELADRLTATESLEDLVAAIAPPRAVVLMVPAGDIVDDHIARLRPLMDKDDLIIDAGNANFRDTIRRAKAARDDGVPYLGIGVSGGEDGARHGPSIMGGGDGAAWERVAPILTAIAAKHDGTPCATYMGPDGAGHFVKAVHNGIEYADMQMIAEIYGLLRDGRGASYDDIAALFERWDGGPLQSYLVEITAKVCAAKDPRGAGPLLAVIEDTAGQKGTGRWTAIEAQHLAAPVPVIEAAVAARNMSALKDRRAAGEARFGAGAQAFDVPGDATLERALIAGKILCYSQGFDMLSRASADFDWSLPLPEIAKVWRAGCIIRSAMLDDMADALTDSDTSLMLSGGFANRLEDAMPALRDVVARAIAAGHAVPALAGAVTYFDTMRTARGTADMIQGQRDFFGWHGFARLDDAGRDHHGPWVD
ncbi:NADP-dependent phosphogluconate dehydrogenase [Maribius pontilimi]|uniref:6-phosphogluconate dehydrogenase, decarboxylating n=1 Tax=Palleronia pontilimi TaxID=1964209 RepID=A0A934IHJ7_9RHOB|nr:NADP-dependent phosphogluconate dehydrogenase [Palleronia pontilimi]MBJ3762710.1 NADP-dependent phosphogluconate dehydrogenase [Palleronia pontilimi]